MPAAKSAAKVENCASVLPAGTVNVCFDVRALVAGLFGSKPGPAACRVGVRTSAATSPSTAVVSVPVKPGVTLIAVEPLVPVPLTCSGAAAATGFTASWLRTLNLPLVQVSDPNAYSSKAALVRVKVTV